MDICGSKFLQGLGPDVRLFFAVTNGKSARLRLQNRSALCTNPILRLNNLLLTCKIGFATRY